VLNAGSLGRWICRQQLACGSCHVQNPLLLALAAAGSVHGFQQQSSLTDLFGRSPSSCRFSFSHLKSLCAGSAQPLERLVQRSPGVPTLVLLLFLPLCWLRTLLLRLRWGEARSAFASMEAWPGKSSLTALLLDPSLAWQAIRPGWLSVQEAGWGAVFAHLGGTSQPQQLLHLACSLLAFAASCIF